MTGEVLKTLGSILAAGGGGAVVAWGIFAKFSDGWLAEKFAKRLETFKHEQAKELEHLRHTITSLFSRISKIHEKEFEVLPTAWHKLHQAYGRVSHVCSALKQTPDLDQMNTPLFEAFVADYKLHEARKKELLQLQASNRNQYYGRLTFWSDLDEAKSAQRDLNNYLVQNRIFMTESLCQPFNEINTLLGSILISKEIASHNPSIPTIELQEELLTNLAKIQPLLSPLEAAIQKRLHFEEA